MSAPDMLKAAIWHAKQGHYIFPIHNPIFDDAGNVSGCTCEDWKRTQPQYGPDFKCDQPGKCPRVKWHDKSTTDAATIRKWWGKPWRNVDVETGRVVWSYPNIGIDAGKSVLLIFDRDLYKKTYAGDDLQTNGLTIKSKTGGGGIHEWYEMPAGKAYGNATGKLPDGIDVRGAGGYIVAPPSLHKSGQRYAFVEGHSPRDCDPLPLPQFLIDILEAAQVARAAVAVSFADGAVPAPDLARWSLADDVLALIHNGAPKGERSEADYRVMQALARAGAGDDDIRAVFVHHAIGEKYGERGDVYLAHSIGKVRAWLAEHPPDSPTPAARLEAMRAWVRGPDCIARLRLHSRRAAELVPTLDALCEIALEKRSHRIAVTTRLVADRCAVAAMTTSRHLGRLATAGLLTAKCDQYGTVIDLSPLLELSVTPSSICDRVTVRSTSDDGEFFTQHRGDDAFTTYPYTYAQKRRGVPIVLLPSLGAAGLLLWAPLIDGGSVDDLVQASGLSPASIRSALKFYRAANLLEEWREGRIRYYLLRLDAEQRLEQRREHMTTYGVGQLRIGRNESEKATYAQRLLQGRDRDKLEPRERAKLENRRNKADAMADAIFESLLQIGIDPHAKVKTRQVKSKTIRFDARSEWESTHRDVWETWTALGDGDRQDKLRMLTLAYVGEDADPETYQATRRSVAESVDIALSLAHRRVRLESGVGQGRRQFAGVAA